MNQVQLILSAAFAGCSNAFPQTGSPWKVSTIPEHVVSNELLKQGFEATQPVEAFISNVLPSKGYQIAAEHAYASPDFQHGNHQMASYSNQDTITQFLQSQSAVASNLVHVPPVKLETEAVAAVTESLLSETVEEVAPTAAATTTTGADPRSETIEILLILKDHKKHEMSCGLLNAENFGDNMKPKLLSPQEIDSLQAQIDAKIVSTVYSVHLVHVATSECHRTITSFTIKFDPSLITREELLSQENPRELILNAIRSAIKSLNPDEELNTLEVENVDTESDMYSTYQLIQSIFDATVIDPESGVSQKSYENISINLKNLKDDVAVGLQALIDVYGREEILRRVKAYLEKTNVAIQQKREQLIAEEELNALILEFRAIRTENTTVLVNALKLFNQLAKDRTFELEVCEWGDWKAETTCNSTILESACPSKQTYIETRVNSCRRIESESRSVSCQQAAPRDCPVWPEWEAIQWGECSNKNETSNLVCGGTRSKSRQLLAVSGEECDILDLPSDCFGANHTQTEADLTLTDDGEFCGELALEQGLKQQYTQWSIRTKDPSDNMACQEHTRSVTMVNSRLVWDDCSDAIIEEAIELQYTVAACPTPVVVEEDKQVEAEVVDPEPVLEVEPVGEVVMEKQKPVRQAAMWHGRR